MQTIDDILQGFRRKEARLEYAESLYERACRDGNIIRGKTVFFPKTSVDALEQLLKKVAAWHFRQEDPSSAEFEGWITVLQGSYDFVLYPKVRANRKRLYNIYQSKLFGKHYSAKVPFAIGNSDDLRVEAFIDNTNLRIVVHNPVGLKELNYDLKGFATFHYFKKMIMHHSSGVAVRRTNDRGEFRISGNHIHVTNENANKYIITFFDGNNGAELYFDLFGKRIFKSGGPIKAKVQVRLKKAAAIAEEMQSIDTVAYSISVADELKQRWQEDPSQFAGKYGWRYIVNGSVDVKCTNGMVFSDHYQREQGKSEAVTLHRYNNFTVAASYTKPTVRMQFAGPCIAFYDEETLINAHKYAEPINYYFSRKIDDSSLGIVTIHTSTDTKRIKRNVGAAPYIYEMPEIIRTYGKPYDTIQSIGSLVNTVTGTFEILIKGKDGSFTSLLMDGPADK